MHPICECAHSAQDHGKICLVAGCPCMRFVPAIKPEPEKAPEQKTVLATDDDLAEHYARIYGAIV
jgi:hypothetical protein